MADLKVEPTPIHNWIHPGFRRPISPKVVNSVKSVILVNTWLVAKRRQLRHTDILLSDSIPQYLAIRVGILQLLGRSSREIVALMTRKRSSGSLHPFDPKIEKTLNKIRKFKNMHVGHTSGSFSTIPETNNFETKPNFSDNPLHEPDLMENNNNRTLKELVTSDVLYQSWCIQYPQLESAQMYELKSELIHLLSKYHSLVGEDPHKHLNEFLQGIPEDYIKMNAFPFSFDGVAKEQLYLQSMMFTTWEEMKRMFLKKFFPTSRIAAI
ncbi:hypothetical protein CR513_37866, partial [Mucuna pruriens]